MKKHYFLLTTLFILGLAQLPAFAQDWNLQTVGDNIHENQLVKVDNNGIPHVLTADWYYVWNGLTWDKQYIPWAWPWYINTFCINSNNIAHFATLHYSNSTYLLAHQYLENGNWMRDTIFYGGGYYPRPIAIFYGPNSGSEKPDLLYLQNQTNSSGNDWYEVYISKYNTTTAKYGYSWLFTVYETADLYYPYADYCTDSEGNLYYVYTGRYDEIVFNFYDGTIWSSFYITDGTNDCRHPRITLDQNDIPHVSYYDVVTKDLIHAKLPAQTLKLLKEGKLKTHVPSQNFEAIAE